MFSPFFEKYDGFPHTKELQKKYRELFMSIYEKKIAEFLKVKGINVARRTVAKYREAMFISSSSQRKRLL